MGSVAAYDMPVMKTVNGLDQPGCIATTVFHPSADRRSPAPSTQASLIWYVLRQVTKRRHAVLNRLAPGLG